MSGLHYNDAVSTAFKRLFAFISGANSERVPIPMTAPVVVRVTPGPGPYCGTDFTVGFFVPAAFQQAPPTPSDPAVTITTMGAATFAVASYPGWAEEQKVLAVATQLGAALQAEGVAFTSTHFFTAGYDSPFRLFDRHNEVLFQLAAQPSDDAPQQLGEGLPPTARLSSAAATTTAAAHTGTS